MVFGIPFLLHIFRFMLVSVKELGDCSIAEHFPLFLAYILRFDFRSR